MSTLVSRLASHEAVVEDYCPGGLAEMEQRRPRQPGWPAWCWAPGHVADDVAFSRCKPGTDDEARQSVAQVMSFVAAWRQGKGIYRASPEFAAQLHATTMPDALPGDVLLQLPEWCVYVPLQPLAGVVGAYMRLDWDLDSERPLLGLLFDIAPETVPEQSILVNLDLFLDHPSLSSALAELVDDQGPAPEAMGGVPELAAAARPFVDIALYLCSMDADVATKQEPAATPRRAARAAPQPRVWDVGYRVAQLLRRPRAGEPAQAAGQQALPAAHLRRAHWHTYLVGKGSRSDPSLARRELRWVHPTLVGAGERLPVVRNVR